ncbi:MAG: sugar phosphate isomerase/epimerase [Planctomycetaceae bacterium]|nr:sugar phosphate isomerase/epimerase [Planctomycetaceae bacterium]
MASPQPLKLCFSTLACPDWSWGDILEYGPQFGYQGVEIRLLERETDLLVRPEFQPDQLAQRRVELDAAKFQVAGLGSSVRFDYLDADVRAQQLEIGKRYIDLAHQLRSRFVRVFGDVFTAGQDAPGRERVLSQVVEGLTALGHYAEPRGVLVLMETHGDFAATQWMQTVMERVDHPAVGVLWDTHHPWRFYNEALPETFNRLRPWIRHTHWKDSVADAASVGMSADASSVGHGGAAAAAQAHSLMSGHKPAHYVLFGEGEFPATDALRLLDLAGYDGWYSLEWELAWHPELEQPLVALPDFPRKLIALGAAVRAGSAGR